MSKTTTFCLAVATAAASAGPVAAAPESSPGQLVDALHAAFGTHPARAVHAKGVILEGRFEPAAEAATLTRAPHLQHTASKVTVRFSNFTGIPDIADDNPAANPRGLAIRFTLPNGASTDLISHSFDGFPTATSDEFRTLLLAISTSGPGAPAPTALDTFLASHPIAKTFLTTQVTPASYATIAYFGVNTFRMTNRAGAVHHVRYQMIPDERVAASGTLGPRYLQDEIRARIARQPVHFKLYAQIAELGDKLADPSIAWPASRKRVLLGTITVDKLASNTVEQDRALAFSPVNLPDGIEPADPMIGFRGQAYPVSVKGRR